VKKHTLRSFGILVAALGAAGYSCSNAPTGNDLALGTGSGGGAAKGSGGTTSPGSGAAFTGGSTSSGGSGNGASSGGTSSIVLPDGSNGATGGTSGSSDPDAACASSTASAMLKTVNMMIMFDRSGSMNLCGDSTESGGPPCADPDTKSTRWLLTSKALANFVTDPQAADLRVALRFFPDDNPAPGCDGYADQGTMVGGMGFGGAPGGSPGGTAGAGPNCDVAACTQPLVDIGALTADPAPMDAQEQKILDAIQRSTPPDSTTVARNPGTPTSPALQGAANWATAYATAHPNEKTVIVLITDGNPSGCDTNATNIAKIAATANTAGVSTYVIGVGGFNSTVLNQIAAAGGTMTAFTVSASMDSSTELLAQLVAIKGQALKCELDVPKSDTAGKEIDPNFIQVAYETGPDGMRTTTDLGFVSGADKCGAAPEKDWYFDDPAAPTQIILCPAACDSIKADQTASLGITADCKTHVSIR